MLQKYTFLLILTNKNSKKCWMETTKIVKNCWLESTILRFRLLVSLGFHWGFIGVSLGLPEEKACCGGQFPDQF